MKDIVSQKLHYFLGSYISFFLFMICSAADWSIGGMLFKILAVCLFGMFVFSDIRVRRISFEKVILLLFGMFLGVLMLARGKLQGEYAILNTMCVVFMLMLTIIYLVLVRTKKGVINWIVQNKLLLLIMFVFALFSAEVINAWFMWDAQVYYAHPVHNSDVQGMLYNFNANFTDIDNLYLAGHVSIGYSLWLMLFQLIKEGSGAVQVADIILAEISIFAYYQILRKLLAKKIADKWIALATILYAASPFVLGMVGYLNLDSATMYFLVIFIACSLYRFKALEWVCAFCLCFTKETAVVYYFIYIVTKIVCDYLKEYSFCWKGLIKFGFANIYNYIYALPVILWAALKCFTPVWGGAVSWSDEGVNCFGIDLASIIVKLKEIFLLNFNWIFWGSIFIGGITLWIKKLKFNKILLAEVLPICSVGIAVVLFGCIYVTWPHVRYITPAIPVLYLTTTIIVANLEMPHMFSVGNIILSILLFIQSFYVIDPVMDFAFSTVEIGDAKTYGMNVEGDSRVRVTNNFADSSVYNRQYIYWQETLIQTLRKAGYDGTMLMVFPESTNCSSYVLLGQRDAIVLWDTQNNKFEYVNENMDLPAHCKSIRVCGVSGFEHMYDDSDVLYIIPRWAEIDVDFISDKKIIRYGEVDNKGFNIQYMVMNVDNELSLENGKYIVSPKQDGNLNLCTEGGDGGEFFLGKEESFITLNKNNRLTNHLIFEEHQVALDVPRGRIDDAGTVQVWSTNSTSGQKWVIEEIDGYYMICFKDYALTYNLEDMSINLQPRTGNDNQLWLFSN
ncbi:MAG: hypothetical protein K2P14_10905 [Anaeroplasmataceae bacterium]|nr:hypothetical protein [Anaeroplasmataceae bacterium]